jgi:hypothetical protein
MLTQLLSDMFQHFIKKKIMPVFSLVTNVHTLITFLQSVQFIRMLQFGE